MPRTTRLTFMSAAAVATALSLAMGSVVAQDDGEPMDAMEQMEPGISVTGAWTRESMMRDLAGAAYMVIHNSTDDEDTLVGASSPAAAVVEIHETSVDEDGAMVMMHVGEIALPPLSDTVLEPGGYHIMLIDLVEPLAEGAEIELSLEFATAGPQTITVPVAGPMGPDMDTDSEMVNENMSDEVEHRDKDRQPGETTQDPSDDDTETDEDDG